MRPILAASVAGAVGGVAWIAGLLIFFKPAQAVLSNPADQSARYLAVLAEIEPLPRVAKTPLVLPAGLILIGIAHGFVDSRNRSALGGAVRLGADP